MGDEVASLLAIFNSFKKSGKSATLILSTKGGEVTAKLEVKLSNAKSSSSSSIKPSPSTLLTPPGCQASRDRQRPQQSAARRTKANARAAQYRLHQALPFPGGDYTAAVGPAPPRRPLHHHPSPPTKENRRLVLTVKRKAGYQPTFSQLDGDEDPPPTPPSPPSPSSPPSPPSPPPPPPACQSWCMSNESHCEDCGLCFGLCPEHHGCNCDPEEGEEEDEEENTCKVCRCSASVRYTRLGAARKWPYMTDLDDPKVSVITYK